jgi:hypothetical protein
VRDGERLGEPEADVGCEDEAGEREARPDLLRTVAPLGLRGGLLFASADEREARGDDARPRGAGGAERDAAVAVRSGLLDEAGSPERRHGPHEGGAIGAEAGRPSSASERSAQATGSSSALRERRAARRAASAGVWAPASRRATAKGSDVPALPGERYQERVLERLRRTGERESQPGASGRASDHAWTRSVCSGPTRKRMRPARKSVACSRAAAVAGAGKSSSPGAVRPARRALFQRGSRR